MYGVVHGGLDQTLRRESVEFLASHAFDGMAIGGSVGKTKQDLVELMAYLVTILPDHRPRHLLGTHTSPHNTHTHTHTHTLSLSLSLSLSLALLVST
jgi:tRNA-guanine family transglycosylase